MNENTYDFNLTKEGKLNYQNFYTTLHFGIDDRISYCTETRQNELNFYMCRPEIRKLNKWDNIAKIASCGFLILTILIYLYLKKTNNLFGKLLVIYCFTELMIMSVLIYMGFNQKLIRRACSKKTETDIVIAISILRIFFLMQKTCKVLISSFSAYVFVLLTVSKFSWLNILWFDIWNNIGYAKYIL